MLHRLAESFPRNGFLGTINVYKYGLSCRDRLPKDSAGSKAQELAKKTELGLVSFELARPSPPYWLKLQSLSCREETGREGRDVLYTKLLYSRLCWYEV
jgi:hypothetical protein